MAYAALSSLIHTLDQLLQPNQCLVCASCIHQHVESAYQSLFDLQVFLEDTNKEMKDTETVKVLEKKIRDVIYKAEDRVDSSIRNIIILADCKKKREKACRSFYEEMIKVEKEVYFLKKEVMLIEFKKHGSNKTAELARTSSLSRRYPTEQNTVVGMEDDFNSIIDRLIAQTNELTVIPIVGMGGIGKTTIARKVYDDLSIQHRFDVHAWITISEVYDERKMLLELVSSITWDKTERNKQISNDELAEIAYRGMKFRRFLVVIDDIWSDEAWDQMRRIFPNDNNKSRILLTTRLNYVADFPPHKMSFLSLDESWNLFIERVFRKDPCPPQLEGIGRHIIQQCQGLPLSIIVIAGFLGKVKPIHENWKKVEENLNSFFGTVSEQCQSILSLSYTYLPQHLKACFLYIGGFPEDMEISVSHLIRLWIGELFINARSNKRLEVVAEEYLQDLIDRSLILVGTRRGDGRMKTCKIHDLLRQLCIREAQIENVGHVMADTVHVSSEGMNDQWQVMLPLYAHEVFVYLPEHGSGTTRSLVCTRLYYNTFTRRTYSNASHFKLLKVLDVYSCYCDFSRVIPHLVHLRYVAARIKETPSLDKLWNLQIIILDTLGRSYLHLPPDIWTMTKIRHLDIGFTIHMPNPLEAESHGVGKQQSLFLNNLQTLALPSSLFVAEILRRTPNLNKLKIKEVYSTHWSTILDGLFFLAELEKLHIWGAVSRDTINLSRHIFLPNLKKLKLYETFFPWEDMVVLANFPNLEQLKAEGAFWGTDWILSKDIVFKKLKYLRIQRGNLERWEATSDNFPVLEKLVLIGLRFLEKIPQGIGEIMTLELIQIEYCSSKVVTSAKKIQQEQESWGNYGLQVRII